ncbi:THAP domain-containing protein 1-like isoform X2 [Formica exsecta]|uniref:THAP domain-containing protein 1-like isoform X2 n=1 Tax=Formica exsecta TaxID=72781 RepID=UPI0011420804|nr:THAP domain-containing protein 1-like isoform X2 [Formica exsecta]
MVKSMRSYPCDPFKFKKIFDMVQKCIYCGKNQKENNIEKKQSFHKFPDAVEHSNIFQKCVSNMNLKSIKISKHSRLCSDHFEEKNFAIKDKNIYLKPGSVPTLFSKTKVQCIFCKTEKGTNQARSFHKFPMNNPNILNMWIANMHMENLYPTSDDVLCSDHFKQDCFLRHGQRKTLQPKRNAIPTIFIVRQYERYPDSWIFKL